jgi:hypothetical protein
VGSYLIGLNPKYRSSTNFPHSALHCTALHCNAMHPFMLGARAPCWSSASFSMTGISPSPLGPHCTALHCTALHCAHTVRMASRAEGSSLTTATLSKISGNFYSNLINDKICPNFVVALSLERNSVLDRHRARESCWNQHSENLIKPQS